MAKGRDAFGTVLRSLRATLREGRHPAGTVLNIADLAASYSTSTTPVREALAQLAGEGLIEDDRGRGHVVAGFAAGEAASLYALCGLYLGRALRLAGKEHEPQAGVRTIATAAIRQRLDVGDPVGAASELFWRLVTDARDRALAQAYRQADARLGRLRAAEAEVLGDSRSEVEQLVRSYVIHAPVLEGGCEAYHQRRALAADLIQETAERRLLSP